MRKKQSRRDAVTRLGAHVVIDPQEATEHGPYDAVLELVGAASLPSALSALAIGGRVAVIGIGSGTRVELDLRHMMATRARISGSMLRSRDRTAKAAVIDGVRRHVLPHLAAGALVVPIWETFSFSDVNRAYDRFEAGGKLGKIVLVNQ